MTRAATASNHKEEEKPHRQDNAPRLKPVTPLVKAIAVVLIFLHIALQNNDAWTHKKINLRANRIIEKRQYWRLFTHALFHKNNQHLGINLLGLYQIGGDLERKVGTRNLLVTTIWTIGLSSIFYIAATCTLALACRDQEWYDAAVKGFSGVLFHWTAILCHLDEGGLWGLDFFEGIRIPAPYYPWASALILFMVDPENEGGFLIHVIGILLGTLHVHKYMTWILPAAKTEERTTSKNDEKTNSSTNKAIDSAMDAQKLREARLKRFT